jgi:hypothetical protein
LEKVTRLQEPIIFVGFEVLAAFVMKSYVFWDKSTIFWRNMSPPSSGLKNNATKEPT